jgi:hypothetical protein
MTRIALQQGRVGDIHLLPHLGIRESFQPINAYNAVSALQAAKILAPEAFIGTSVLEIFYSVQTIF